MPTRIYTYHADGITVTWDKARCIHYAACVRGLPAVFDPGCKPWIEPDRASADAVQDVVVRCPTGALQATRSDGGEGEHAPRANAIAVEPDGPLFVRGRVALKTPDGAVRHTDTRVALCRCGLSSHKPFCDGSHEGAFHDPGALGEHAGPAPTRPGPLAITLAPDGPLRLRGPVTVVAQDGSAVTTAQVALCRCGQSGNKPFCDGSHRAAGFRTDEAGLMG